MQRLSAVNANVICTTCTVITTLFSAPQVVAMQQQGQQLLEMHTKIEQQLAPRLQGHPHSEAPPDLAYVVRERQLALSLVGLTAEEGTAANLAKLVQNSQSPAAVAAASLPDLARSGPAPRLHAPQPALPMVQPPPQSQSFSGLPTPTNHSQLQQQPMLQPALQPALTTAAAAAAGHQWTPAAAAAALQLADAAIPSPLVFTGAAAAAAAVPQSTPAAAAAVAQTFTSVPGAPPVAVEGGPPGVPGAPVAVEDGPPGWRCGHCHAGSGVRCTWVPRKAMNSKVELYYYYYYYYY